MRTIHRGVWRPDDGAESPYRYLPVDVPPDTGELRVTLAYDSTGGGLLDLGCFGPAGEFRGYSGGARDSFAIAETATTPGYLPGPLDAGTWHVMLGLHRVPHDGVEWTVTADTARSVPVRNQTALRQPAPATERNRQERGQTTPPQAPAPWPRSRQARRVLPAPPGHTWLAGDLHAHTVHSDGSLTVTELAALAAGAGLDFLAVTDHNTVTHHAELATAGDAAGIVLVPGQEVTTGRGHANAFGDIGWVDFRRPADDWVSTVEGRGGLLSVNHPLGGDCAWLQPLRTRPPLAEVWHSGWWDRTWGAPLAWLLAWDAGTVPIGGSDFHTPDSVLRPGQPTTWVLCADRTVAGVLDGLRAGGTAISAAPDAPVLLRLGDTVIALDADGALLVDFTGRRRPVRGPRAEFTAPAGPHWLEDHRAQVLAICG
jgi:hypothetical protein